MTTIVYLQCALTGLLGIGLHLFAFKIPAERKRSKAANVSFILLNYLKEDIYAIVASFITLTISIIAIDEIVGYKPSVMNFIKLFFAFIGYTGSSIMISLFGQFGKKIQQIVDVKTDIADEK